MANGLIQDTPGFNIITLSIAIVGAVTGVLGLVLSAQDRSEEHRIELVVRAKANQRDYTNEGFGLRVSVVNSGLRGVALTNATLYVNGQRLAVATDYLADRRPLDRYQIEPAAVTDQRLDLPVSVPTRNERNIVLLFGELGPPPYDRPWSRSMFPPGAAGFRQWKRRRTFDSYLVDFRKKARVSVVLEMQPGGRRTYHVSRLPGMTPRFQWQVTLDGKKGRTSSISLRRKLAASGQSDVVSLDVWSDTGHSFHRSLARPIVGDVPSTFPVHGLGRDRYVYAFRLGGKTLVAGRFRVPEPCASANAYIPGLEEDPTTYKLAPAGHACDAKG